MTRFVSTTAAGTPMGGDKGYRGASLAELMARQKALEARSGAISADNSPLPSPWQGVAKLADAFVTARQGAHAEQEAGSARDALAGIYAGIDPAKGIDQQQLAEMSRIDPEAGQRMYEQAQRQRMIDADWQRTRAAQVEDRDIMTGLKREEITADKAAAGAWKPSDISSRADDYTQAAKTFDQAAPAWQSMKESAARAIGAPAGPGKGAADYAMVVGLAKILDPTSVVREGEVESVRQTGGPADYLVGILNSLKSEGSLSDDVRRGLMTEGSSRMKAYYDQAKTKRDWISGVSTRHGVNPDDVVPPLAEFQGWTEATPVKKPEEMSDAELQAEIERQRRAGGGG